MGRTRSERKFGSTETDVGANHMDDATYQRWWQLHLRVAKGEELDPSEQMVYDSGLKVLDQ